MGRMMAGLIFLGEEFVSDVTPTLTSSPMEEVSTYNFWPFVLMIIGVILIGIGLILKAKLLREEKMKKQEELNKEKQDQEAMSDKIHISNLHHIGKRQNQQDAFGISNILDHKLCEEKGVLVVLADGMGGLNKGAEVSALVVSYFLKTFPRLVGEMGAADRLLQLVRGANNKVTDYLEKAGKVVGGSTVISVIVYKKKLYFISVGDSHIYLLRNGSLSLLNHEHTYGRELDEKAARGEISFFEAQNDPQRKALTSYIGLSELVMIDRNIRPVSLLKGDRLLLMSDGVFGTLSEAEIIAGASLENIYKATQALEKAVLQKERRGQDNFTAVILEVGGSKE